MSQETMNPHVEYRPIPGFDEWRYRLGKDATAWYKRSPNAQWRKLRPQIMEGRVYLALEGGTGRKRRFGLGRLMLLAYRPGTRNIGDRCYFGEKGPLCCELSNLSWRPTGSHMIGSACPRLAAKCQNQRGENNPSARLTEEMVCEARRLYAEEQWSLADVADYFGVGRAAIGRAISGQRWGHIPGAVKLRPAVTGRGADNPKSTFSEEEVREIRRLASLGTPRAEIARRFEATWTSIARIISRRTWSHVPDPPAVVPAPSS